MDKFLVPQFIDIEAKIFGPITVRQFVLSLIALFGDFIFYKLFRFNIFLAVGIPFTLIVFVFAFAKINGMPFHNFALNLIQTLRKPSLRVWQKAVPTSLPKIQKESKKIEIIPTKAPLEKSRLSNLSLMVDTGGAYSKDIDEPTRTKQNSSK